MKQWTKAIEINAPIEQVTYTNCAAGDGMLVKIKFPAWLRGILGLKGDSMKLKCFIAVSSPTRQ
jgi:hypothetical protein